ncbi:hypothetical protein V6N13_117372 [Hibiscus sabdariffa]
MALEPSSWLEFLFFRPIITLPFSVDRVFAGLYDFYNYGPEEPQYSVLLNDFLQVFTYTYLKCSTHIMACKLHRHILLLGDNKEATKEAENRLEFIKVVTSEDSCLAVPDNILLV